MNLKKFAGAVAVAAALAGGSSAANAYVVLDNWQVFTGLAAGDTNIGHLNLAGGDATVNQEVADLGGGNFAPFVGARFSEYGVILSVSYTRDNVVGTNDTGAQSFLGSAATSFLNFQFEFDGLAGTVTSFDSTTGKINYAFTPGVGSITMRAATQDEDGNLTSVYSDLATLSLVSGGGDLADYFGVAQTNGNSTIVAAVTSLNVADLFRDAAGNSLDSLIPGGLLFEVLTTNQISAAPVFSGACEFDASAFCATSVVTSEGSADALRVPEPGTLALLGLGLLGLGAARRRTSK